MGSLFFALALAGSIACTYHLVRAKKDWWWLLFIWLFAPIGAFAYFIVEWLPELRGDNVRKRDVRWSRPLKYSTGDIAKLEKEVEFAPNVDNQSRLAEAYAEHEAFDKAEDLYSRCLRGAYKDDGALLFGMAKVKFSRDKHQEAADILDQLDQAGFKDYRNARKLLRAKIAIALGDLRRARKILEPLKDAFTGEEARYTLASVYRQEGNPEKARELFEEIQQNARYADAAYRKRENEWIKGAEEALRS